MGILRFLIRQRRTKIFENKVEKIQFIHIWSFKCILFIVKYGNYIEHLELNNNRKCMDSYSAFYYQGENNLLSRGNKQDMIRNYLFK